MSYTESFHATLQFNPRKTGYEAGIVLWWSQYSHAAIGIRKIRTKDGREVRTVTCREPTGQAGRVIENYPLISADAAALGELDDNGELDTVQLAIRSTPETYTLSVSGATRKASFMVRADALTVMPLVGGAFAGVMFGLYSFGAGEPVLDPADFTGLQTMG
jgi:hypothetical protein